MENIKPTTQQLINALDCWLNPDSTVDCEDCPFHNLEKPGSCREATLRAVTERLENSAPKLVITKLEK